MHDSRAFLRACARFPVNANAVNEINAINAINGMLSGA